MGYRPYDGRIVSRRDGLVKRRCLFCEELIEDEEDKDIEFIVHLGKRTEEHLKNKEWVAYVKRINPASPL